MLLVALLSISTDAHAFCLTHGCDATKQVCEYDANGCMVTGPELRWPSSCVSYDVQKDGSALRGISYDDAHAAIGQAFAQWLGADCGGGATPSLTVQDFGPVECRQSVYNKASPNANIFMFRDDSWPYQNAIDTLALTTVTYDTTSGDIYDADVEVNTFQTAMTVGPVGPGDTDFNSVITHEVGHFLGLAHSNVEGATMQPNYEPGSTALASIEQDDIDGVCATLDPTRVVSSNSCEPRHGFSGECTAPQSSGCQLSTAPARGVNRQVFAFLIALGGAWTLRRRQSRRGSRLAHSDALARASSSG